MEFKCSECGKADEVTTCSSCKRDQIWDALLECTTGGTYRSSLSRSEILEATIDADKFDRLLKAIL
jgi:hypothetical protein